MRVAERAGDRPGDCDRFLHAQLPVAIDLRAERLSLHVWHHIVEELVGRAGVVEWEDVGVLQVRRNLDFLHEALTPQASGKFRPEHFDGDLALVPDVACQIDGGHTALADLSFDVVPSGKNDRQPAYDVAHRGLRYAAAQERASISMAGAAWFGCICTSTRTFAPRACVIESVTALQQRRRDNDSRVSPRQSPSSTILFELSSDADWPWFAPDFFTTPLASRARRSLPRRRRSTPSARRRSATCGRRQGSPCR